MQIGTSPRESDIVEEGDVEKKIFALCLDFQQERMKDEGEKKDSKGATLLCPFFAGDARVAEEED